MGLSCRIHCFFSLSESNSQISTYHSFNFFFIASRSVATTLSIPTGKGEDDKREREQYRLVALAIELQVREMTPLNASIEDPKSDFVFSFSLVCLLVCCLFDEKVAAAVNQSARHDRERRAKRPRTIELMPLILGPDFAAQDAQGDRGGDDDDHDGADENSGEVDAGAQVLDVAAYKARIRSILASLRVNATLRENVMSGKVSARFLARADASDLATDETRQVEVQAKVRLTYNNNI